MLGNRSTRRRQGLLAFWAQRERDLAPIFGTALAAQQAPSFERMHDRHGRRPVHLHAPAQIYLRDAGVIMDEPQYGDLLLRQIQLGEVLREMTHNSPMRQPQMKPQNVVQLCLVSRQGVSLLRS